MELLCVHVPAFALEVARRDCATVPSNEAAVLADKADRGRIIAVDAAAYNLGARVGHTVLQAHAAAGGEVHVLVHDAHRSRAVWSDMLDALDAISPIIDDAAEGTAYADMRGIGSSPQQWRAQVLEVLRSFELPVRAAVAGNKFVARARTYSGSDTIDALPVSVLEVEPKVLERLRLLGVGTLGELAALPHGPFVRRFGKAAAQWHEWARGIDRTPVRPRAQEVQIEAAAFGEGSAEAEEQVLFALRVLADRICTMLERAGRAANQVQIVFECENGDVRVLDTGFAQATADRRTMLDVIRAKIEGMAFEAPITGLRMQAMRLEECGAPAALFGQMDADPQALAVAFARLQALTGSMPQRARTRASARLEGRFGFEEFGCAPTCHAEPVEARPSSARPHDTTPTPQLKLHDLQEIRVRMRGNVPACVQEKRVLNCAGPWRVDDGWFCAPVQRDEYDVLLEDGLLCRIYRQNERWYLRGIYD